MYVRKLFLSMVSILYFHSETEITYHSVCRFQNLPSCSIFGKGAATLEGALRGDSSILYVFFLSKKVDILQKLDPLSFTFGLVTHLTHHVLKLTHGLALFERATIVERRTFGTDAFLFLGKLGIWAATTEKCWAVLRYVIHGDVWLLKGLKKNGNLRLNEAIPYLWRPESKTFTIFRYTFSRSQLLDQYSCEVSEKTIDPKLLQNHAYKATENCVCGQKERVLRLRASSHLFPESSTISSFLWYLTFKSLHR